MRPSRLNPKLSAYSQVHGHYNYSVNPIAPPGMRVLVHDLPKNRKSWAPHASDCFYIGPALDHYRCYRILNPRTNATRVSETVRWTPHNTITVPTPTPDELLRSSIHDLVTCIRATSPQQLPHLNATSHSIIRHLQQLFMQPPRVVMPAVQPPPSPLPWTPPPPFLVQGWRHPPSDHHLHLFERWRHPNNVINLPAILYQCYPDLLQVECATSYLCAPPLMPSLTKNPGSF